jgi:O-antigen/teichoic acid export membrane protein
MLKFIFKNAALYTIANQIPMFANLILLPIISKFLNKEDYYIFGTVLAYGGVISVFSNFGLIPSFQNAFFKDRENFKSRYGDLMFFLIRYRILYTAVLASVIYIFFKDDLPPSRLFAVIFLYVTPSMFLELYKTLGMRYYQFNHRHAEVHKITLLSGIITVISTFTTVYIFELHYFGWFISLFIGNVFQGMYFRYKLRVVEQLLPAKNPDQSYIKSSIKFGLPTIPHNYSSYLLNTADRLILDQYKTAGDVQSGDIGLYNVAYGFAGYFDNLNGQINSVVSPIYFDMFARNDLKANHIVRQMTFVWFAIVLAMAFLLSIWSKEIFYLMYIQNTDQLQDAYKYSIFLFMAFTYRPMYVAAVDRAIFNERSLGLLKISLVAGILNVVLNIIFIPIYGVQAAIFATFLAYMYQGFSGHFFKDFRKYITLKYYPILMLLVIFFVSAAAWWIVEFAIISKALLTATLLMGIVIFYYKYGKAFISNLNHVKHHGQ